MSGLIPGQHHGQEVANASHTVMEQVVNASKGTAQKTLSSCRAWTAMLINTLTANQDEGFIGSDSLDWQQQSSSSKCPCSVQDQLWLSMSVTGLVSSSIDL